MGRLLREWVGGCADFLLPPACPGCGGDVGASTDAGLCVRCRLSLRPPAPPLCPRCGTGLGTGGMGRHCTGCATWPALLVAARASVRHETVAARLVWSLKYDGWSHLAVPMGRRMAESGAVWDLTDTRIAWIPTTSLRRRLRGYDQARLLAEVVAKSVGRPLVHALTRPRFARTQVAQQPRGRLGNVHGAFSVRSAVSSELRNAHILLVDDVLTTGATAVAASGALERAGVSSIRVLAFARATPFRRRTE